MQGGRDSGATIYEINRRSGTEERGSGRGMRSYLDAGMALHAANLYYVRHSAIVREQEKFVRERTETGEAGRR